MKRYLTRITSQNGEEIRFSIDEYKRTGKSDELEFVRIVESSLKNMTFSPLNYSKIKNIVESIEFGFNEISDSQVGEYIIQELKNEADKLKDSDDLFDLFDGETGSLRSYFVEGNRIIDGYGNVVVSGVDILQETSDFIEYKNRETKAFGFLDFDTGEIEECILGRNFSPPHYFIGKYFGSDDLKIFEIRGRIKEIFDLGVKCTDNRKIFDFLVDFIKFKNNKGVLESDFIFCDIHESVRKLCNIKENKLKDLN